MNTMIEPDTRGTDALSGKMDDSVAELAPLIWEGIIAELGPVPEAPQIDPFDEQPWKLLPTMEDLEELWAQSAPLDQMLHRLAITAHGDGDDLPRYMAAQRELADMELRWKKERDAEDAATADAGRSGEDGPVGAAGASAGGVAVSRRPKNGDTLGEADNATCQRKNRRRSPKVPGGLGAGIAASAVTGVSAKPEAGS